MKNVINGILIGLFLTGGTTLIAYLFGWSISEITIVEYLGVFTSYVSTWLCVKRSIFNFHFAIISVLLYSILFYTLGLYSSMTLQIVLLPILVHGLWLWIKNKDINVEKVSLKVLSLIVLGSSAITVLTVMLNGTLPLMDSSIFFLSLIAQYLLISKKIETWYVWAIVNVIAIITYFYAGAYLATLQYVLFLANTVYGYHEWKKGIISES
ncbi:Nicotinamide riboside transporter PnuC [compost metagenome]